MGLPVVISRDISDDSQLISEAEVGVVINDFSKDGLTQAAKAIKALVLGKTDYQHNARKLAEKFRNIENQIQIYKKIYRDNSIDQTP